MSAALNLPLWQCNSPPSVPDCSEELDVIIKRLAAGNTDEFENESCSETQIPLDNGIPASLIKTAICDSVNINKFENNILNINNNITNSNIYQCREKQGKCEGNYVCQEKSGHSDNGVCSENVFGGISGSEDKGLKDLFNENKNGVLEVCSVQCETEKVSFENKKFDLSANEIKTRAEEQRYERRQHELLPQINTSDVMESRDPVQRLRTTSCSTTSSTCSAGSYSRRKHHQHKQRKKPPVVETPTPDPPQTPSVNPIFLWVRQEDTRIVEVLCEDYDHRNRIRLAKTPHGWRSIPKTERFSSAIIPKVSSETKNVPKKKAKGSGGRRKKGKKSKKSKKIKQSVEKEEVKANTENIQLKECSVALSRDELDLSEYTCKDESKESRESTVKSGGVQEAGEVSRVSENLIFEETGHDRLKNESETSRYMRGEDEEAVRCVTKRESLEMIPLEVINSVRKLPKSTSCEFQSLKSKGSIEIKRSSSVDLNLVERSVTSIHETHSAGKSDATEVQSHDSQATKRSNMSAVIRSFLEDKTIKIKNDPDCKNTIDKDKECVDGSFPDETMGAEDVESLINQRPGDPNVLDITEQGSDFTDTDCDELGQLLKDIPDLEFDDEVEDEDEFEESSLPTDLTLPKAKKEEAQPSKVRLPILPSNISSLVTVTSSTKPPEPLTAPLPEVTITPILNPKPAHQQKPQNKFLESLLSSPRLIKSERDEITITRTSSTDKTSRSSDSCRFGSDKKPIKQQYSGVSCDEPKIKKLKLEDITLKNLLSKSQDEKPKPILKIIELDKKIKTKQDDSVCCSKSRLHELLTAEGVAGNQLDPISQLKQVLSNPELAVPDPLLVPRARLPALVASPANEIPRLLNLRQKQVETAPCPPLTDPDMLVVSLAHLQSLLSCNPDGTKCTDAEDLASYQKSLEAFLDWQRYQTQLMEAQLKNSSPHTGGMTGVDIDVATATALNQMLWLPYLNQLEAAAMACGNNREFMTALNSVFPSNYPNANNLPVPPHISTNHFPQSSPFLTPTSPMEIEAQMKTLAMWQEAVMSQQNVHTRTNQKQQSPGTPHPPQIKVPSVPPPSAHRKSLSSSRTSPISQNNNNISNHGRPNSQHQKNYQSPFAPRYDSPQNQQHQNKYNYENFQLQQLQQHNIFRQQAHYDFQRKQKQQQKLDLQFQKQLEYQHHKHLEMQQQQKEFEMHQERQKDFQRMQEQQLLQLHQFQQQSQYDCLDDNKRMKQEYVDKKTDVKPVTGGISVKPLSNLLEQPSRRQSTNCRKSSWQQFEEDIKKNAELTNQMAVRWQQFEEEMRKSQIQISKNQKNKTIKSEVGEPWQTFEDSKAQPSVPKEPEMPDMCVPTETPKLKVKNLVDPSMSPPKLLKPIDPSQLLAPSNPVEEMAPHLKEDPHANLWHPLFGSNQTKNQSYNSPWRWTTVTVNGE